MNKEEIDKIRKKYKITKDNFIDEKYASIRFDISFFKDFEILLNYIDKLRKELKDSINARFELQRKIDKIKETLGDKNIPDEMILTYIETLASENNRLEDIEDRKVQIEYNNVFNEGVKSVEDKIRTKIKELEEKCEAMKKTYTGTYALNGNYLEAFYQIVILRELLGDE